MRSDCFSLQKFWQQINLIVWVQIAQLTVIEITNLDSNGFLHILDEKSVQNENGNLNRIRTYEGEQSFQDFFEKLK